MSRFWNGLNKDIVNVLELQPYIDVKDLVHLAIKVEKQIKKKSSAQVGAYLGFFLGWKMSYRREGNVPSKSIVST
jgi:hypothetical protein